MEEQWDLGERRGGREAAVRFIERKQRKEKK